MPYKNAYLYIISIVLSFLCYLTNIRFFVSISEIFAEIFIHFIKTISIPVVFLSVVNSLLSIKIYVLRKIAFRLVFYVLLTTIISTLIAMIIYSIIKPVDNMESELLVDHSYDYFLLFKDLIPNNIVGVFLENNVIGVLCIAFLIGYSSFFIEDRKREVLSLVFSAMFDIFVKISSFITKFIPLIIYFFSILLFHQIRDVHVSSSLFRYTTSLFLSNALHGLVFLPILLYINKINPFILLKKSFKILTLAFFTKSSSAVLPSNLMFVKQELKVNSSTADFSIPLCASINMNACAAFILTTILFVVESNGISIGFYDMLFWMFFSTIAAVGNAAVPMGCYFMANAYLITIGVPIEIMGLILPIYVVLDMFETAENIWSDICITKIIDKKVKW
ncbi:MAG: sodium/glutamate symporter family protein [Candidatus Xenolissoclinum pacificiensis L6]|uniref:Sodium/glutamate symporter family protein n=1 Tax=Candidatus Xenolissoclinum pacificiensis L6 TaxID=1401685 RepID=W2V397_9RICK|nr:MAG: sodium/glutamate symporter family protein [Candidatus Xenolissoclinum pacificiensis L6]